MRKRIARDPGSRGYRDAAIAPPESGEDSLEMYQVTGAAREAVAKAKADGSSVEMGKIEPVKTSLTDYRFTFWGEEFKINPLLFAILGLAIGVVSRSFGIGGGFLLVPAMTTG